MLGVHRAHGTHANETDGWLLLCRVAWADVGRNHDWEDKESVGGENDGDAGIKYGRRRDRKVSISTTAHFLKPAGLSTRRGCARLATQLRMLGGGS